MIIIDETKIEKWKDIQGKHKKAVKCIVKNSIEKFEYKEDKYKLKKKEKEQKTPVLEFDEKDKKFFENLLDAKISNEKSVKIHFYKNGEIIEKFAVGKLEDIFKLYYRSILKMEEFKNIKQDELKNLFILDSYRRKIIQVIDNDGLNGSKTETLEKRKGRLEKYFNNTIYPVNLSDFDDEFIKQYNKGNKFLSNKGEFKKIFKFKIEYQEKINTVVHLNNILKKIFNYDTFQAGVNIKIENNTEKWDRHMLISMLNISTCPYCNRQYISNYIDSNVENKTTADLDHFYSQGNYAFLALSLYNFIPSCQICNSRFKLQKDFYLEEHLYPYEESFGENAWFETNFIKKHKSDEYNIDFLFGLSNDFSIDIKIKKNIEDKLKNKIKKSIETFKLKEVYKNHTDYVREIIKKSIIYNESKITELYTQYPEIFKNRTEVLQMLVSNYICDEDFEKRPLAKLTKDICEELGLE